MSYEPPGLLAELLNPFILGAKDEALTPGEQSRDLLMKVLGGVALAAAFQGARLVRRGATDPDRVTGAMKSTLDRARRAEYVSIPSSTTLDVYEDLLRREDGDGGETVLSHKTAEEGGILNSGPLRGVRDFLGGGVFKRVSGMVPTAGNVLRGLTMQPAWHGPVAATVMLATFLAASRAFSKKVDETKKDRRRETIDSINREIGGIVEREARRMHKTSSAGQWVRRNLRVLTGLGTVLMVAGAYMGYKKGVSENQAVQVRKAAHRFLDQARAADRAPEILIPEELRGDGDEMGREEGTQVHARLPELRI